MQCFKLAASASAVKAEYAPNIGATLAFRR